TKAQAQWTYTGKGIGRKKEDRAKALQLLANAPELRLAGNLDEYELTLIEAAQLWDADDEVPELVEMAEEREARAEELELVEASYRNVGMDGSGLIVGDRVTYGGVTPFLEPSDRKGLVPWTGHEDL